MAFTYGQEPQAFMGFVGYVRLKPGAGESLSGTAGDHGDYIIRATTADITLSQEISKPDIVDSRYDKTLYQLGPRLVDGTIGFPAVYDIPAGETYNIFELLFRYAVERDATGNLKPFDLDVKYASPDNSQFTYKNCIANTWQFSVTQSDVVTCSTDIIGIERVDEPNQAVPSRKDFADVGCNTDNTGDLGTTRIVTWNDARVEVSGGSLIGVVSGKHMRSFEANINNDAERFYTLNKFLEPQAIAARKRDIDGTIVFMGRQPKLSALA